MVKQAMVSMVEAPLKYNLMMRIFLPGLFLCCVFAGHAQETLTAEEKAALDSMFRNDEFFKMLNEKADSSYFDISIGGSNGVFSIKNNSVNAEQATTSKIFYTPSIGYFHKSGFGITASCYIASDDNKLKVFQYAVSPSYTFFTKKLSGGISYTRYITGASTAFDVNPYKNDLYANIIFRKLWLRPAIGMGYSVGRSKQYFDSVVTFTQVPRTITITDTVTTKLSSFSLNFSISHVWSFRNILFKHDEIDLQPCFMINGSNQKLTVAHSGNINRRRPLVQYLLKHAYGDSSVKERFSLQSLAFLLGTAYGKGKFILQPQLYLDYYLHDTESKKLSAIYSFSISYAF